MKKLLLLLMFFPIIGVQSLFAQAAKATTGSGLYKNDIFWLNWDLNGDMNDGDVFPTNKTITRTFIAPSGITYEVNVSNVKGGLIAKFRDPDYCNMLSGYGNMGATSTSSDNIISLQNKNDGGTASFTLTVNATYPDGTKGNPKAFVIGGSESLNQTEYYQLSVPTTSNKIRYLDKYIKGNLWADMNTKLRYSNNQHTLRVFNDINSNNRGDAVILAENVPSIDCAVQGQGMQGFAVGFLESVDFSDAPSSYGKAVHLIDRTLTGGFFQGADGTYSLSNSSNKDDTDRAIFTQPLLQLGDSVEADETYAPVASGVAPTAIDNDAIEDTQTTLDTLGIKVKNMTTSNANLYVWIDVNNNGSFDSNELLTKTIPANTPAGTIIRLSISGISGLKFYEKYYVRLRLTTDNLTDPSGFASNGEVEDHRIVFVKKVIAKNDINQTPVGVTIEGGLVLANDSVANGDTLELDSVKYYNDRGQLTSLPYAGWNNTPFSIYTMNGQLAGVITFHSFGTYQPQYTFTPQSGFTGKVSLNYTAADSNGGDTDDATLVINVIPETATVNNPPVATDDAYIIEEFEGGIIRVLKNDFDIDGDALTIQQVTAKNQTGNDIILNTNSKNVYVNGVLAGEASVAEENGVPVIVFYPVGSTTTASFIGDVIFKYTISDFKGGTAEATATVKVLPDNSDTNVYANDDAGIVSAGQTLTLNVLDNDKRDYVTSTTGLLMKSASVNNSTPLTLGTGTYISGVGTITLLQDGTLTFQSDAKFVGTVQVNYTAYYGGISNKAIAYLTSVGSSTKLWVGSSGTDFNTAANWSGGIVPNSGNDIIFATAANNNGVSAVSDMKLPDNANIAINNLTNESTKATIIPAGASLTVNGIVTGSSTMDDAGKLQILANATDPNGSLILSGQPCASPVYATVQMYAKGDNQHPYSWVDNIEGSPTNGTTFSGKYTWQYFGVPVQNVSAYPTFSYHYLRKYDEEINDQNSYYKKWITLDNNSSLYAFKGYEITQDAPGIVTIQGALVFCDHSIILTRSAVETSSTDPDNKRYGLGQNIFGNSFTASIPISSINLDTVSVDGVSTDNSDRNLVEKTVYLYNTGSFGDWGDGQQTSTQTTAGTYIAVPQETASTLDYGKIPSMNGFLLRHIGTIGTHIKIDLPYNGVSANAKPQTAPRQRRGANSPITSGLSYLEVKLNSKSTMDKLWLISQPGTTMNFDNGWDGRKFFGTPTAYIYTPTPDGIMQVNTTNNILGTYINFIGNNDPVYTLTLKKVNMNSYNDLRLLDLQTGVEIPLDKDTTTYTFTASNNGKESKRFLLKGKSTLSNDSQLNAYAIDKNLYVTNSTQENGTLTIYDISGRIRYSSVLKAGVFGQEINPGLQTGSYIVKLIADNENKALKVIIK